MYPSRGIIRTYRCSEVLSMIPDDLNILKYQSPNEKNSPRDPFHLAVIRACFMFLFFFCIFPKIPFFICKSQKMSQIIMDYLCTSLITMGLKMFYDLYQNIKHKIVIIYIKIINIWF